MTRFLLSFAAAVSLLAAALPAPARARTWSVLPDGTGDAPTLRAAVDSAASGDTLLLGNGSFTGADNRGVRIYGEGLTIRSGGGDPAACVIDCEGEDRAFHIEPIGGAIRIEGITFRNGSAENGGALRFGAWPWEEKNAPPDRPLRAPVLRIVNCRFLQNSALGMGGAVYAGDESTLEVEETEFHDNTCLDGGGTYSAGGALCFRPSGSSSACAFRRCLFEGNRSDGPGGALYLCNAQVLLEECEIAESRSGLSSVQQWPAGAGVLIRRIGGESPEMAVTVDRCLIRENRATMYPPEFASDGGGIMVKGQDAAHAVDLHVKDTRFEANFSAQGAGLYVGRFCEGLVERCRFVENLAYTNGGGSYKGGAIDGCLGEAVRFEYCEFLRNGAGFLETGEPNRWSGRGGAFMTRLRPRAEFVNCSFSGNRAEGENARGDAIYHWDETGAFTDSVQRCLLLNCVFFGEEGDDIQVRSDPRGFTVVAGCAWEPGEFACAQTVPADTVLLSGSPFHSADSLRLAEGSRCIDRGIDLGITVDIEGAFVPQGGGPEIGAYETPDSLFTGVASPGAAPVTPAPARLAVRPNPFNPETTVAFSLEKTGPVRLTAHDLAGRLVAVLADGVLAAGPHRIPWNGTARGGRPLPSGIYLIRLEGAGGTGAVRAVLLR